MLSGRVKLQLVAFLLLSGGVAANLLFLQPQERGRRSSTDSRLTVTVTADRETTGSIGERIAMRPLPPIKNASTTLEIPREKSAIVRAVQRELQIRGYETGGVDGIVGAMTRAAIMSFEFDQGLPLTGNPSQELLKRILLGVRDGAPKPMGSKGQSAEAEKVIRTVQTSLARLGYKPGRINGKLTPETARAIRRFEADQALPETGRPSGPLVARLARLAGSGRIASGG